MAWFGQKGDKDRLKTLLKKGKVLLAKEVRYKNYSKNSYQFRVVKREKLIEMKGNRNLYEVIAYKPGFNAKLYFDIIILNYTNIIICSFTGVSPK